MKSGTTFFFLLFLLGPSHFAVAQSYPNKPIRMIVPGGPGSPLDISARLITQEWSTLLQQQIIVDNRPSVSGLLGSELVAKSAPDGYTLLWGNVGPLAISPGLYKKMPYDIFRDFAPISQVTSLPFVVYSNSSLPVNSLKELVEYAKERPGKLNYAAQTGGGLHLTAELFRTIAGIDIVHVPYKNTDQALTDIVAGRIHIVCYTIPSFLPHVRTGRVKALVIASTNRFSSLPQVPTSVEVGMPAFQSSSWHAVVTPAGIPKEIVAKLHRTLMTVLSAPSLREQLINQGAEVVGNSPEELSRFMHAEVEKWRRVIKTAGVKLE